MTPPEHGSVAEAPRRFVGRPPAPEVNRGRIPGVDLVAHVVRQLRAGALQALFGGATPKVPRERWGLKVRDRICENIGHQLSPADSEGYTSCLRCLRTFEPQAQTGGRVDGPELTATGRPGVGSGG